MAQEVKRCIQCGMLKEADNFRQYTYAKEKGTTGRFRICRSCESINSTYTRLHAIRDNAICGSTQYANAMHEIAKIDMLYSVLESHGLRTPRLRSEQTKGTAIDDQVTQLTQFYAQATPTTPRVEIPREDIPDELRQWLEAPVEDWVAHDLSPEYLQETIYESLKAKYRPQTGVDHQTYLPIYDDTYKAVLNDILRRFDDYEEQYANNESEGVTDA